MKKVLIINIRSGSAARKTATLFERYFLRETGIKVKYSSLLKGAHGKPLPIANWYFNVSHSGQYWAMALSDEGEVGVDIERRRDMRPQMARRILMRDEDALEGELLRSWVLKEAYVKMLGDGLRLGFRSFSTSEVLKKYTVIDYSTEQYYCYVVC